MNSKQVLGLIGSVGLIIGVFSPLVSVPIMGNMNYFQNGKGDGIIVLTLAIVSLFLILAKNYRLLWFTGFTSFAVIFYTFLNFQSKMSQVKMQMGSQLADNPFHGLADIAMKSVQLQWGWAILVIGSILVIASAATNEKPKCPHCGGTIVEDASKCKNCGSSLLNDSGSSINNPEIKQGQIYTINDIGKNDIIQPPINEQKEITIENITFTADEMKVIENKISLLEANECVIIHSLSRIIKRVHKNDYNKESKWIVIKEKIE